MLKIIEQSELFKKIQDYSRNTVPRNIILDELPGVYGASLIEEVNAIISYYNIYDYGAEFIPSTTEDYTGSKLKYKQCKSLIDKEARFMFSNPPEIRVEVKQKEENYIKNKRYSPIDVMVNKENKSNIYKENESMLQDFVDEVLDKNNFNSKLLKAAKDCFIGKRVALVLNFNEKGIQLNFVNSLEFVYETDEETDELTKIITFFIQEDNKERDKQRFYKKKYELEDGTCYVEEAIYDGYGEKVEDITERRATGLNFVPAVVIINDGLTGDLLGESEIESLFDSESYYSKMSNADMDSENFNMNVIRYLMNVDPESSKNLSVAPGSVWDLVQDMNLPDGAGGAQIGTLESNMNYSSALDSTLKRIKQDMYSQIDMPDVSSEALKGMITSGKALKAIYWPLSVRVGEKMLEWGPKLQKAINMVIEGVKLITISNVYDLLVPDVEYEVVILNRSPIQEDEVEEKQVALSEVSANVLSRKTYLKKYYKMNDEEALDEIYQIALEKRIVEESYNDFNDYNERNYDNNLDNVDDSKNKEQNNLDDDQTINDNNDDEDDVRYNK